MSTNLADYPEPEIDSVSKFYRQSELNTMLAEQVDELSIEVTNLQAKLSRLESQHATALNQAKKSHSDTFTSFKADVIVTLKALELMAIASQRHGGIALNHHVRDMRLAHLQGVIQNAIEDFSDRKLTTYDDDF